MQAGIDDFEKFIVRIIKRDGDIDKKVGTGFFINKYGHFITARHIIPSLKSLDKYKLCINGNYYSFSRIEANNILYDKEDIDILILEVKNLPNNAYFPLIYKINFSNNGLLEENNNELNDIISSDAVIFGYRNTEDGLKNEKFNISGFDTVTNTFQLQNHNNIKIVEGCSGSPVFLSRNGRIIRLIGIMSHSKDGDKVVNNVYSINLIEKLGYLLPIFERNNTYFNHKKICKRINFFMKIKFYLGFFYKDFFYELHQNFEHKLIEVEQKLELHNNDINTKKIELMYLLQSAKDVFDIFFKDVSIHIKAVDTITNNGEAILRTDCRVQSRRERKSENKRKNIEKFILTQDIEIQSLKNRFGEDNEYKVNIAYNQTYKSDKKYWICNNLKENDNFYATSNNYHIFYNSLCVFGIYDKKFDEELSIEQFRGFLIIDSYETGIFENEFMKQFGGYLAHRINRFISNFIPELFQSKNDKIDNELNKIEFA